jgi:hypothetical protein
MYRLAMLSFKGMRLSVDVIIVEQDHRAVKRLIRPIRMFLLRRLRMLGKDR